MPLCARGGCTASAEGKYCSKRCAAVARLCAGWIPQASLTPAVRAVACRRGALTVAKQRRVARRRAVMDRLRPLLNHRAMDDLTAEQREAVSVVLTQSFRMGKAVGYQEGWHAKSTPRLKRARKDTAA
jgi:hypothetical protein